MRQRQLYVLLFQIARKSEKRIPSGKHKKSSTAIRRVSYVLACLYLAACGIMLGLLAASYGSMVIFGAMPYVIIIDFSMRFAFSRQTINLTPYLLLPLSKHDVTRCFIVSTLASRYNITWLCLFVPYAIVNGTMYSTNVILLISIVIVCQMLILINSLWHLLVSTLTSHNSVLWLLVSMAFVLPLMATNTPASNTLAAMFFDFCCNNGFSFVSIITYIMIGMLLFALNKKFILRYAENELAGVSGSFCQPCKSLKLPFPIGSIGEYIKLEMLSVIRNRNVRRCFAQGILLMLVFSVSLMYNMTYASNTMPHTFWTFYCFIFFGGINLTRIMEQEGNYIDLLMTRCVSLHTLLIAKYYYYCTILLLPLAMLLPCIAAGKLAFLLVAASIFTTSGPAYCALFQLAVSNNHAMPLNESINGKQRNINTTATVTSILVFLLPALFMSVANNYGSLKTSLIVMVVIGIAFTATHRLWLKNIYIRMARQKHENIDTFYSS